MKKYFMEAALAVAFCLVAGYNVYVAQSKNENLPDVMRENIEALANNEDEDDAWTAPRTVRCAYWQGSMVTSSVERICEFCVTPNSCTPVSCGSVFY